MMRKTAGFCVAAARRVSGLVWRLPRLVAMGVIRAYQLTFSYVFGSQCRFWPTCSHYGYQAFARHGFLLGSYLTVRRLLRCQPWGGCGIDPVPMHIALPRWAQRLRHLASRTASAHRCSRCCGKSTNRKSP